MRYKPLALRVLSTAAMLSIVASCAAPAFAATYDLNKGDVSVSAESDGKQYVSQWTNDEHTHYAQNDKGEDINHLEDNNVTLTSKGEETKNTITVSAKKDQEAKVTLDNVNIDTREDKSDVWTGGDAAVSIQGEGNVAVELNGSNKLQSGNGHAGLEKNTSDSTGTLTIQDKDDNAGSLSATGGTYGAGIGGGIGAVSEDHYTTGTSNISITGGDISATGGAFGAGIGGGGGGATVIIGEDNEEIDENVSGIHVSGGTLTALGTEGGAGIGGGSYNHGDVSDIHISGVKNATIEGSYFAASIGNGAPAVDWHPEAAHYGTVSDITISDSNVTLNVSNGGVGIGSNYKSTLKGDTISITGTSDVTVQQQNRFQTIKDTYHVNSTNFIGSASFYDVNTEGEGVDLPGHETEVTAPCEGKITYVNEDGSIDKTISGHGHTWGEWETVKEATTTETGLRQRVCSVCGAVEQEEIPMLTPAVPTTPTTPTTPAAPTAPAAPTVPAAENTSAPELRVLAPDSIPQTFTVKQSGTVRTYESPYNSGTLTGTMETLEYLQEQGAQTIVFTTNQRTSSFQISELLALVNEGDVFYLNHMDANEPTLLVVANDHSELLG